MALAESCTRLLNLGSRTPPPDPNFGMNSANPIIQASKVAKTVQDGSRPLHILRDINFAVQHGETLAIVGVSGSGKSTLLGLLAGLDLPSAGRIDIAGQQITALDEDQRAELRAKHVGFVFQSFQLLPNLTALENVMLPLEILNQNNVTQRARAALTRVGLKSRMTHYPSQLSGGEQQRTALARAFITTPSILFADEPTGNLDNQTGARVTELLFDLNQEHRTTLVLVTHNLQLAERCQRIATMQDGSLSVATNSASVNPK